MTLYQMRPPQIDAIKIPTIPYGEDPLDPIAWGLSEEEAKNRENWLIRMLEDRQIVPTYRAEYKNWVYTIQTIQDYKNRNNPEDERIVYPEDYKVYLCRNLERTSWSPWVVTVMDESYLNRDFQLANR